MTNAVPSLFAWNSSLRPGLKPKALAERDPLPFRIDVRSLPTRGWRRLERTWRTVERTSCSELECFRRNQPFEHNSNESKSTLQRRNCECLDHDYLPVLADSNPLQPGVLELIRKLAKENISLREELNCIRHEKNDHN